MRPARPVAQFALTGLAAVVLLGFVGVTVLRRTGTSEAIRDARNETRLAAAAIVVPALPPDRPAIRPAELARLDAVIRRSVLVEPVVHVKIWDADGRILYSDEHRLVGERHPLSPEELRALHTGGVAAAVSDLTKPENRFERRERKLLEVYLGVLAPGGRRLLFETYRRYESIAASSRRLWLAFLPALVVVLVLLWLVQVPLAWSLARRLERGRAERERLLHRAIEASDGERRRIAADLHDGVVQDLVGVSYELCVPAPEAAGTVRRAVRDLRLLLVDMYPPELDGVGLEVALRDLLDGAAAEGLQTSLYIDGALPDISGDVRRLLYRAAREALRNVHHHARAASVAVRLSAGPGRELSLEVVDDGIGYAPPPSPDGHMGLRILGDLARAAGGRLEVTVRPAGGTRFALGVPPR